MLKTHVMDLPRESRILDLCCGDMHVLRRIAEIRPDLELYGVDSGDLPPGTGHGKIKFTKADIKDFVTDTRFQMVLAIDVLEHLPVPQQLVRCARNVLVEGGDLYVCVPSVTKLFLFGDANFYSDYTHVRPFNKKGLSRLLQDNGFQIRDITDTGKRGIRFLPRFFYYLARGIFSVDTNFMNAAIAMMGGIAIEALAKKEGL